MQRKLIIAVVGAAALVGGCKDEGTPNAGAPAPGAGSGYSFDATCSRAIPSAIRATRLPGRCGSAEAGRRDAVFGVIDLPIRSARADAQDFARREIHFTCDRSNDFQQHAIEPLYQPGVAEAGSRTFVPVGEKPVNMLGAFLSLTHDRTLSRAARETLYLRAVEWTGLFPGAPELLLHALESDEEVDPGVVASAVEHLAARSADPRVRVALLRCVAVHLDPARDRSACERMVRPLLGGMWDPKDWTDLDLDVAIRLVELGLATISISEDRARRLLATYAGKRPDFVIRIRALTGQPSPQGAGQVVDDEAGVVLDAVDEG